MGWKNLVRTVLIIFFLMSCCPIKKWYNTKEGYERPKRSHFKLAKRPYVLKSTDPISTKCVYQCDIVINRGNGDSLSVTRFFRFFDNGRYLVSTILKDKEPIYSYNNIERGHVGYFEIKNTQIVLEQFSVGPQDCGKYSITHMEINEDGIGDFKKIIVEGLTGTPDW